MHLQYDSDNLRRGGDCLCHIEIAIFFFNMTETISAAAEIVTVILKMHFLQSPTDINYSNIQKLHYLKSYIYLSDIAASHFQGNPGKKNSRF